jgi:DNA-binding response OmpR family regulator
MGALYKCNRVDTFQILLRPPLPCDSGWGGHVSSRIELFSVRPRRCQQFVTALLLQGVPEVYFVGPGKPMETVLIIEDSRPMQRTLKRLFEASVPIVVLSANADVDDKVVLLELGADDYVTKPFSPKELLARVRRAMRRNVRSQQSAASAEAVSPHDLMNFGDVEIDFTSMEAQRSGKPVNMTAQEFKLLRFLSRSTDRVISREELLNEVWGYQNYPSTRTVDNHILRLRQKLEPDPGHPRFFVTVHSAGYKFVPGNVAVNRKS